MSKIIAEAWMKANQADYDNAFDLAVNCATILNLWEKDSLMSKHKLPDEIISLAYEVKSEI